MTPTARRRRARDGTSAHRCPGPRRLRWRWRSDSSDHDDGGAPTSTTTVAPTTTRALATTTTAAPDHDDDRAGDDDDGRAGADLPAHGAAVGRRPTCAAAAGARREDRQQRRRRCRRSVSTRPTSSTRRTSRGATRFAVVLPLAGSRSGRPGALRAHAGHRSARVAEPPALPLERRQRQRHPADQRAASSSTSARATANGPAGFFRDRRGKNAAPSTPCSRSSKAWEASPAEFSPPSPQFAYADDRTGPQRACRPRTSTSTWTAAPWLDVRRSQRPMAAARSTARPQRHRRRADLDRERRRASTSSTSRAPPTSEVPRRRPSAAVKPWVLRDGVTHGTWSRTDAHSPWTFTDDAGAAIELNPGNTWVELAKADALAC